MCRGRAGKEEEGDEREGEVGADMLSTMSLVLARHFDFLSSPLKVLGVEECSLLGLRDVGSK